MRVMYGHKRTSNHKPFVIVFQRMQDVGAPIIASKTTIIHEREVTPGEYRDIVRNMPRNNRIYHFNSVEDLADSELRNLVITPLEVVNNLKLYEQTTKPAKA